MKTIEEINSIAPYHPCEWQQGYGIWQAGYIEGQKEGAAEQKAIDDAERKNLIEKVIWLIEDSYPDTYEWGHSNLVENVMEDFERRADELKKMFD